MSALDLLFSAVDIALGAKDPFLELSRSLNKLQKADPQAVRAFCKLTKMNRRKAYYLIEIDRYLGSLDIPAQRMTKIGWTKLRLIGPHANTMNIESLLEKAEKLTARTLAQYLAGLEPQTDSRCVQLYFTPLQYAIFSKRLAKQGYEAAGSLCSREDALIAALQENSGS